MPIQGKSFQPTHQDRKQTGNIAEYFRRSDNTPKPTLVQIQGKDLEEVLEEVPDLLIEKLETMIKSNLKGQQQAGVLKTSGRCWPFSKCSIVSNLVLRADCHSCMFACSSGMVHILTCVYFSRTCNWNGSHH